MMTQDQQNQPLARKGGSLDAVYGMGLIGAWVFYFKQATTTQQRVQAFFRGIVWPAYLVYDLLVFLEKK